MLGLMMRGLRYMMWRLEGSNSAFLLLQQGMSWVWRLDISMNAMG